MILLLRTYVSSNSWCYLFNLKKKTGFNSNGQSIFVFIANFIYQNGPWKRKGIFKMIFTYQANIIRKFPKNTSFNCSTVFGFPLAISLNLTPIIISLHAYSPTLVDSRKKLYYNHSNDFDSLFSCINPKLHALTSVLYTFVSTVFRARDNEFRLSSYVCANIILVLFLFFASCCLLLVSPSLGIVCNSLAF